MTKIERIAKKLSVPIQLFACTEYDVFRKPRTGAWQLLAAKFNGGVAIDEAGSVYCGDAAGRLKDWATGKKKDFSCSDRLFALNVGIKFLTPEEFFLGERATAKFEMPSFDPRAVDACAPLLEPKGAKLVGDGQPEVVLLVGVQGSGKSYVAENHFESAGYVVASNDRAGSRDKAIRVLQVRID